MSLSNGSLSGPTVSGSGSGPALGISESRSSGGGISEQSIGQTSSSKPKTAQEEDEESLKELVSNYLI